MQEKNRPFNPAILLRIEKQFLYSVYFKTATDTRTKNVLQKMFLSFAFII